MKFADVKNDVAFRKIFGNKKKTQILISFLNAVLQLEGKQREAYLDADQHKWKKEELIAYDNASIAEQDEKGKLTAAKKRGKEEGKEEKIIEAVIEMYNDDVPVKTIAKYLKVNEEKVLQIIEMYLKEQENNNLPL